MKREEMIANMEQQGSKPWDVVVVGGGATGLGAVLDAVSRGCRALLIEKEDFAKGTSSRSTKLIHGGVRYLRQGNIRLVRESLRERGLLMRNAPGIVSSLPFVVPSFQRWDSWYYGAGLKMYDLLAGKRNLSRSRHLSLDETIEALPGIASEGLRGGTLYVDAQFDDASLALAIAKTAAARGAVLLNYMPAVSLLKRAGGGVEGVVARDEEGGKEYEIHARVVISATGPFSDELRQWENPETPGMIVPSRGAHLVLDRSFFPASKAMMIPRTDDGRVLFLIPWQDRVLLGTTDTPCGEPTAEPIPSDEEVDYLLEHASRYLEKTPRRGDVRSMFAGLRPLVKPEREGGSGLTSTMPRDHEIRVSKGGIVTVTGGKWTTYRKMAEEGVDVALEVAGLRGRTCRTENLALDCGPRIAEAGARIHPDLPYGASDLDRAIEKEMARTLEDLLARRTRALFLDARAAIAVAPEVAGRLGEALGKGEDWVESQISSFEALARRYLPSGGRNEGPQGGRQGDTDTED